MRSHLNKVPWCKTKLWPAAKAETMGQNSLGWLKALFAHPKSQQLGAGKAMGITLWWFLCVQLFLEPDLWAVVTLQSVKYTVTPSLVNPGPWNALASYMAHLKPFLQDLGGQLCSQARKDAPHLGSLHQNRAARAGLGSSYRHLGFTCYKEAAILHLQNLHKSLKDY